ncbi:MAG: DUF6485 family protein [Spirochaetaceae bacterium]|jgi:hypothetical protein|nr:DUF6485 family protein [Spirochaetaceae bacterium]
MTAKTCNVDHNKSTCTCSFSCGRKGLCCECVEYHRSRGEMPGCYFPKDAERGGDRSIANFINIVKQKGTAFLT